MSSALPSNKSSDITNERTVGETAVVQEHIVSELRRHQSRFLSVMSPRILGLPAAKRAAPNIPKPPTSRVLMVMEYLGVRVWELLAGSGSESTPRRTGRLMVMKLRNGRFLDCVCFPKCSFICDVTKFVRRQA